MTLNPVHGFNLVLLVLQGSHESQPGPRVQSCSMFYKDHMTLNPVLGFNLVLLVLQGSHDSPPGPRVKSCSLSSTRIT